MIALINELEPSFGTLLSLDQLDRYLQIGRKSQHGHSTATVRVSYGVLKRRIKTTKRSPYIHHEKLIVLRKIKSEMDREYRDIRLEANGLKR